MLCADGLFVGFEVDFREIYQLDESSKTRCPLHCMHYVCRGKPCCGFPKILPYQASSSIPGVFACSFNITTSVPNIRLCWCPSLPCVQLCRYAVAEREYITIIWSFRVDSGSLGKDMLPTLTVHACWTALCRQVWLCMCTTEISSSYKTGELFNFRGNFSFPVHGLYLLCRGKPCGGFLNAFPCPLCVWWGR